VTSPPLLALVGPTASGKTEASIVVATALDAEVVSIDPALAYRGMDVWTAKPTAEDRRRVPHHLIDLREPTGPVGVAEFQALAGAAIADIRRRGRRALLVGASGLYFRAVADELRFPGTEPATRALLDTEARAMGARAMHRRLEGFDPEAAGRIEPGNARRTVRALEVAAITGRPFSSFYGAWATYPSGGIRIAAMDISREVLHRRIERRARDRFPALKEETVRLMDSGFGPFVASGHVIGYAEAAACARGELDDEQALAVIVSRDKKLARRQIAWFRRDPRVRWFQTGEDGAAGIADQLIGFLGSGQRAGVEV
jgi:tRNA dimethylallyltransferase